MLKTLSLTQPWATLVARGIKNIETRSWPAPKSVIGQRIGIHATATVPTWVLDLDFGDYTITKDNPRRSAPSYMLRSEKMEWPYRLPLGAIVATAILVDCVRTVSWCGTSVRVPAHICDSVGSLLHHTHEDDPFPDGSTERDVTDQRPYGDFTAGRWAWILDDIHPIQRRCPGSLCENGTIHFRGGNVPWTEICPVCNGKGHCEPISTKGHQRLWNWHG